MFAALQARLATELERRKVRLVTKAKLDARMRVISLRAQLAVAPSENALLLQRITDEFEESFVNESGRNALDKLADRRSILDFLFLALLVSISQRILVAISIQLLAASVKAQQPSRLVRTVSLVGLASFFVFVESLTHRTIS